MEVWDNPMNYLRTGVRLPLELPVRVEWKTRGGKPHAALGKTASMSGNGLLMQIPTQLPQDMPVAFSIPLPVEITLVPLELFCHGRIVRQGSKSKPGLGVIIDEYEIRPLNRANFRTSA